MKEQANLQLLKFELDGNGSFYLKVLSKIRRVKNDVSFLLHGGLMGNVLASFRVRFSLNLVYVTLVLVRLSVLTAIHFQIKHQKKVHEYFPFYFPTLAELHQNLLLLIF